MARYTGAGDSRKLLCLEKVEQQPGDAPKVQFRMAQVLCSRRTGHQQEEECGKLLQNPLHL